MLLCRPKAELFPQREAALKEPLRECSRSHSRATQPRCYRKRDSGLCCTSWSRCVQHPRHARPTYWCTCVCKLKHGLPTQTCKRLPPLFDTRRGDLLRPRETRTLTERSSYDMYIDQLRAHEAWLYPPAAQTQSTEKLRCSMVEPPPGDVGVGCLIFRPMHCLNESSCDKRQEGKDNADDKTKTAATE